MRTFQKRKVVPRENWMPLKVAEAYRVGNKMVVVVAVDSPELFEAEDAMKMARRTARRRGYLKFKGSGRTEVFGQNAMALKKFYFSK